MSNRRIILLLDGTWNQDQVGGNSTNIVKLRELIANSLDPIESLSSKSTLPQPSAAVGPREFAGRQYIVFYQRGVGTGPFDQVRGGGFGRGLGGNIRQAYRFLSFHYKPGDEIFIFGFSRGAYTARSLTGYLGAVGLLRCEDCTESTEARAWSFYRTSPNDRLPGIWNELQTHVHRRETLRVSCLGLFDTVGALGIPLGGLWRFNRQKYEFHDVELSSLVDVALHALAIDEHRRPFEASLWQRNKFKRTSAIVEQVWFPGAHADIGGGYLSDIEYEEVELRPFDALTLDWMIKRLRVHFPDFPVTKWNSLPEQVALDPTHNSRTLKYKLWQNAIRAIGNRPLPHGLLGSRDVSVGYDPRAKAVNESVHIKAIHRLGSHAKVDGGASIYAPSNLICCLPELRWFYSNEGPQDRETDALTITAIDGEVVKPQSEAAPAICAFLQSAIDRLKATAPGLLDKTRLTLPN